MTDIIIDPICKDGIIAWTDILENIHLCIPTKDIKKGKIRVYDCVKKKSVMFPVENLVLSALEHEWIHVAIDLTIGDPTSWMLDNTINGVYLEELRDIDEWYTNVEW